MSGMRTSREVMVTLVVTAAVVAAGSATAYLAHHQPDPDKVWIAKATPVIEDRFPAVDANRDAVVQTAATDPLASAGHLKIVSLGFAGIVEAWQAMPETEASSYGRSAVQVMQDCSTAYEDAFAAETSDSTLVSTAATETLDCSQEISGLTTRFPSLPDWAA